MQASGKLGADVTRRYIPFAYKRRARAVASLDLESDQPGLCDEPDVADATVELGRPLGRAGQDWCRVLLQDALELVGDLVACPAVDERDKA